MRALSFPQHRTPGHVGLQNRQSLRTDSCESGTPPHSHGLAKMWSDLAMVWRSPAQSHSALFLPRFYCQYIFCPPTPSFQPSYPGNTLPSSLCALSLPYRSPLPPAFPVHWDLCRWIAQPSFLFTASLHNIWASKRPYSHYPQSN